MLGEAGFFTSLPNQALNPMIDFVKGIEPEVGYGAILQLSEAEAAMRLKRTKRTKTVCTYCGVGCSFDIWTQGSSHLESRAWPWPGKRHLHLRKGKIRLGLRQQRRAYKEAADS